MESLKIINKRLFYLDQTQLPRREVWGECKNLEDGFLALRQLKVRGAPLIGVFSAYCLAIASQRFSAQKEIFLKEFKSACAYLKKSRPTAINLFWAIKRLEGVLLKNKDKPVAILKRLIFLEAKKLHQEDKEVSQKIARSGVVLINPGDHILTHCNSGFLATSGSGTALAIFYEAKRLKRNIHVYVDETRPLLQGARLTAWELLKKKIPATLITDSTAGYLMQKRRIDKVMVGADRIVANGDVANKIGTYSLAVLAYQHKIPFYVVAPLSSFDLSLEEGRQIPIEERDPDEVRKVLDKLYIAPRDIAVFNPAFDVSPHYLISAIITERGIIYPPYKKNILKLCPKPS